MKQHCYFVVVVAANWANRQIRREFLKETFYIVAEIGKYLLYKLVVEFTQLDHYSQFLEFWSIRQKSSLMKYT